MAKSLNLKIKKAKLITNLEAALAERKKRFEQSDKLVKAHEKAVEAHTALLLKLIKQGKAVLSDVNKNHWRNSKGVVEFNLTATFPKGVVPSEPEAPEVYNEHTWRSDKESIENILRMLALSDDEYINTSTLKGVSEYL